MFLLFNGYDVCHTTYILIIDNEILKMLCNQNLLNEKHLIFYSNSAQPMTTYEVIKVNLQYIFI